MSKIVIRRRFPNFVCDGRPLGPDNEAYMVRVDTTEEFFEQDWVKDINANGCVGWFLSNREYIMAVYRNEDGSGSFLCHAILECGKLDIDVHDNWYDDKEGVLESYGLKVRNG